MTMRLPVLLALSVIAAFPAAAQQSQPQAGERLLVSPPAGWKPVQLQKSEKMMVTRLYPPGQDENNWSEIITIQILPGNHQSPKAFVDGIIGFSRTSCEAVGTGRIAEKAVNGYPTASTTVSCTKGKSSGMGGFLMLQAIQGKEALYAVQRQWRGAAFTAQTQPAFPADMLERWGKFSALVGLCDSRDQQHPCP